MKRIKKLLQTPAPSEAKGLGKKVIGEIKPDGCKICIIDGDYVRTNLSIDFDLGGHHYRFPFIKEDEIWVESTNHGSDLADNIAHEIIERIWMKEKKIGYEKAHEIANSVEEILRKLK